MKPTPTNGISTPTPTQSPFISNCDKFYLVKTGDGCEAIATTNSITFEQFYSWNPAVGQCANLWPTYYVCVGMIGFTPTSKPTTASPTTTIKTTPTNGIVTPTPTQSPFISNCNRFYQVKSGDGCEPIATANSISLDQFYAWNPAIGQCVNLWPTYFVCVGIIGFTPTSSTKISTTIRSTSTKTTATNGIATPTPTQSGIVGNCDAFYKVVTNDGCAAIALKYGITTAQFYTWNPSIRNTCANLWPDYYVCVSIVGVNPSFATSIKSTSTVKPSSTSTKANGVATPTPVQTGMIATCKKFYKVVTGDGCWAIADTNKITLDNFYKWNSAVKTDCSALWPGYYVCIGI
jgi:LysM repeat protein